MVGKPFTVYTDHQPLVHITKNVDRRPSPRLERLLLKIQAYEYKVEYKPGSENIADYLSRHPVGKPQDKGPEEDDLESYALAEIKRMIPIAVTIPELQQATSEDIVMDKFRSNLESGKVTELEPSWSEAEKQDFKAFKKVESKITVIDGLLLLGQKIIIPEKEIGRILTSAHQGHQGEEKTKKLLRTKVWFPKLSEKVSVLVKTCNACQMVEKPCEREPLCPTPLPYGAWTVVALDICGPLRDGSYLLVLLDEYSRYPIVQQQGSTKRRLLFKT